MTGKLQKSIRSWWKGFTVKQRLSVTDSDDGHERWYMYISPARIVIGLLALVLMLFLIVITLVAYTSIMDNIPGYPGSKSREMLIRNIIRLDSLEREMSHLTVYSDNIALIMEGKTPVIRDVSRIGDSIEIQQKILIPRNAADSLLRSQMEGHGPYSLSASAATNRASRGTADLMPPAQGLVLTQFNPVQGRFGVEIVTTSNHPVVAVREGSIIMSVWTPEDGNIVQIQHPDNLVSVYKRVAQVQHRVGTRVRGGEILGIAGEVAEESFDTPGPFGFELWYNGTPVDPLNYIVF